MTETHLHPRRTFNPELNARYGRPTFPLDKLVKYSVKYGWACIFNFPYHGSWWRPRMHTVVLSIDGPCRVNDASDPRSPAAWAVYFGRNDPKNHYGIVASNYRQTNSRAELEAVRQAIITVRNMKRHGTLDTYPDNPYKEIIIRLTSQYVVDAFHRDVWIWESNGWKTARGEVVAHAELIREIHAMFCDMEQNMCMAVRFWKTERDNDAKMLAKRAFEELDSGYEDD